MRKLFQYCSLTIFILFCGAGCSSFTRPEQSAVVDAILLTDQGSIGQTFVAHYDGLNAIEIYLEPIERGDGELILHLNTGPMIPEEITKGSISLVSISSPGFFKITFPTQDNSTQAYYYMEMEIQGSGSVKVGTAPGDSYLNGALYTNGQPQDAQLSFNLVYHQVSLVIGLFKEGLSWIGYLLVAFFLYIIPGWALLRFLYPEWSEKDWAFKIALSAGTSLAIYPLLFLWTDALGFHLGVCYAWLPPALGILGILWYHRNSLNKDYFKNLPRLKFDLPNITLIVILGMIFAVRFWVIRTVDAPMGGDSVHHAMITHLLVDHKGLFDNWQPYAELDSFTYHFGFHANTAVFYWVTRMPIRLAILWVGQIFNGLAVLALYPLAKKIGSDIKWAGIGAVFLAGLVTPMPMFYVNWGKYSQLTSQIILPVVIYITWKYFRIKSTNTRFWIMISLLVAGLALSHYRILAIFIFIIPVLWIVEREKSGFLSAVLKTVVVGFSGGILFLPWLIRIFSGNIMKFLGYQLSTPAKDVSAVIKQFSSRGDLFSYLPTWIWIILPLIIIWGIWNHNKGVLILSIWSFLVALAANPSWLNLPGDGSLTNNAIAVASYIPACILLGSMLASIVIKISGSFPLLLKNIMPALLFPAFLAGLNGMRDRGADINIKDQILVTRPDLVATKWIEEYLPKDGKILVNTFYGFGFKWMLGSDGGWWLPILAKRPTNALPMVYRFEKSDSRYRSELRNITQEIIDQGIYNSEILDQINNQNYRYIFIGQLNGNQFNGGIPKIKVDQLLTSNQIKLLYHIDRVWIFEIRENQPQIPN